ncbi:MAG: hypothetical protein AAF206_11195 [Bacteroidota bacterium]
MKRSKVIQFLTQLSAAEMVRLDKFVHSPYFNSHDETTRLFDVLKTEHPDFTEEQVSKKFIYERMYPGESFQEKKLYVLSNYLVKLIQDFLAEEEMRLQRFERDYLALISVLAKKNLEKFVPKVLKDGQETLDEEMVRDGEHFHRRYRFLQLRSHHILLTDNRSTDAAMQDMSDSLDQFFLLEKFRVAVAISNRQHIVADDSRPQLLEEAIQMYQRGDFEDVPLIKLYYLTLMMNLSENGDPYFEELNQLLPAVTDQIGEEDATEIYHYAINHCTRRYKQGDMAFLPRMFSLYQQTIDQKLLFSDPSHININFKNVVTLGLKLAKYEWTEDFIRTHGKSLHESYQHGVMSYSLANLFFSKGEFSRAKKHLMQVEFLDPFYRLNYDMLLLKIYYECDEIETLLSRCGAFSKFIRRNASLSETNRLAYNNMVKMVRRLAKAKFDHKASQQKLQEALAKCEHLVERNWIEEKVRDIGALHS